MRKHIIVIALLVVALIFPAAASASYMSKSVKAAFKWGERHAPVSATYLKVRCQQIGTYKSDCRLTYTGGGSMCETYVYVSGRNYAVRRYDSTC